MDVRLSLCPRISMSPELHSQIPFVNLVTCRGWLFFKHFNIRDKLNTDHISSQLCQADLLEIRSHLGQILKASCADLYCFYVSVHSQCVHLSELWIKYDYSSWQDVDVSLIAENEKNIRSCNVGLWTKVCVSITN